MVTYNGTDSNARARRPFYAFRITGSDQEHTVDKVGGYACTRRPFQVGHGGVWGKEEAPRLQCGDLLTVEGYGKGVARYLMDSIKMERGDGCAAAVLHLLLAAAATPDILQGAS